MSHEKCIKESEFALIEHKVKGLKMFQGRMELPRENSPSRMGKIDMTWNYIENQKKMVRVAFVSIIVGAVGQVAGIVYLIFKLT